MSNEQLFSSVASEYARFRPGYPEELFDWLAHVSPAKDAVWDCACGSGQASVPLAARFARVFGTDSSAEQIAAAKPHPKVSYSVGSAERSGLPAGAVDLVTVAQALHWFDVDAFYAEARRVARPGAVLAVWTYPRPQFYKENLDRVLFHFYREVVGPYWPPERRHVDACYRTLPFPFDTLEHPGFALSLHWNLAQVVGYVSSWSATKLYRQSRGEDPLPRLAEGLQAEWPGEGGTALVLMPIVLLAARLP